MYHLTLFAIACAPLVPELTSAAIRRAPIPDARHPPLGKLADAAAVIFRCIAARADRQQIAISRPDRRIKDVGLLRRMVLGAHIGHASIEFKFFGLADRLLGVCPRGRGHFGLYGPSGQGSVV